MLRLHQRAFVCIWESGWAGPTAVPSFPILAGKDAAGATAPERARVSAFL